MKKAVYFFIITFFMGTGLLSAQESIKFNNLSEMAINRQGLASATDGKNIYAICGGTDALTSFTNTIERYDPATNMWTILVKGLIKRRYCNAEYIPSLNRIYIFNGQFTPTLGNTIQPENFINTSSDDLIQYTRIMEFIDLDKKVIATGAAIPEVVTNAGSAVWNNKIYVFGGFNPLGYSDRLYEYDPVINKWTRLPDMPGKKQTCGKIVNGVLYVFGGFDGGNLKSIDAYNIKESKWAHLGELPKGISATAVAADGKNIWLVGAYYNTKYLAAYNTETNKLTIFKSNMEPRRHAAAQVINYTLYVFGGNYTPRGSSFMNSAQSADISQYAFNKD